MAGSVQDTYAAAVQHDLVVVPEGALVLGVARRPLPWLLAVVDENRPELGPPADLLSAVKGRARTPLEDGLSDAEAHNRAMNDLDYESQYRAYLWESRPAQQSIADLRKRVESGTDLVLVCYENTDEKRCHRTILREVLLEAIDG
ncbi:MAG: DUF488 family protein [Halodesulfurarchaeum sp.]